MSMLDHITIRVSDLEKSKAFYEKTLATLGMSIVLTNEKNTFYGFGVGKDPYFEIVQATKAFPAERNIHVAFRAKDTEMVGEWYREAIKAGGKDNGQPGTRPEYSPTYYAAFVKDLDGNNIEVCVY